MAIDQDPYTKAFTQDEDQDMYREPLSHPFPCFWHQSRHALGTSLASFNVLAMSRTYFWTSIRARLSQSSATISTWILSFKVCRLQGLPPDEVLSLPLSVWHLKRVYFQFLEDKIATKLTMVGKQHKYHWPHSPLQFGTHLLNGVFYHPLTPRVPSPICKQGWVCLPLVQFGQDNRC